MFELEYLKDISEIMIMKTLIKNTKELFNL